MEAEKKLEVKLWGKAGKQTRLTLCSRPGARVEERKHVIREVRKGKNQREGGELQGQRAISSQDGQGSKAESTNQVPAPDCRSSVSVHAFNILNDVKRLSILLLLAFKSENQIRG